jgi:CDP-glycerol glycerophosphotransferase (TagB/SpsB family)
MINKIFRSRKSKANFISKIDKFFFKDENKVLFVVKNRTYFSGNLRVTLESYLTYSNKKIFIYKDGQCSEKIKNEYSKTSVTILEGFTIKSIWHILTSSVVILSHNPRDAHLTQKINSRKIINLWHGVAIKKIEFLMTFISKDKMKLLNDNSLLYDIIIASSAVDKVTNKKAFGVKKEKVKITGLPRYEILKINYKLSSTLEIENNKILAIKKTKRLILYAPTFRENKESIVASISKNEWDEIDEFAKNNNLVFGVRLHPYDKTKLINSLKEYQNIYLFNSTEYIETNLLLKHVDLLVIDFSSIWIDFLLLEKPIIGFSKDYEYYLKNERGFIYDFFKIFPSDFTNNVAELLEIIKYKLVFEREINYYKIKNIFHKYALNNNFRQRIFDEIENNIHEF